MAAKLVVPRYEKSIVNLMASVMNYYGVESIYKTVPEVDQSLMEKPKHVLLLVFDGMGEKALLKHLEKGSFLMNHKKEPLRSVFPPTTTAAMTSYYTGISPAEHGWLGWSIHFRDYGAVVDLFTNMNSYTGREMETKRIAYRELAYKSVYQKIQESMGDRLDIHTVKPEAIYFPSKGNRHHPIRDLDHMKKVIHRINTDKKPSFTAAYWPEPDMTMHTYGPEHVESGKVIRSIDGFVEDLCRDLKDTLIIISADHGQTTIKKEISLHLDEELNNMLVIPPSVEGRCSSFFVKARYHEKFRQIFEEKYGDDFRLYTHDEAKRLKLFGHGEYHPRFDDFIGDFVAAAIENSIIQYKVTGGVEPHHFVGHHAGLTDEEMLIPLIIIHKPA